MSLLNSLFGGSPYAAQGTQGAMGTNQLGQAAWGNSSIANAQLAQQQQQYNMALSTAASQQHTGKIVGNVATPSTSKELDHEAYNTSIENLINLWITRFGNEWIDLATIEDDEFFNLACRRLKQMGELEVHYLTDRARYVCRRPE
jgi:hypothetical protein